MLSVLCFGDSNTYGLIPGTNQRYGFAKRYTGVLKSALSDEYLVAEEGLVGRTTVYDDYRYGRRGIDTLPVCLESHLPLDFLVIMLGTNDCKKTNVRSVGDAWNGINTILDIACSYIDDASGIILVSPAPLTKNVFELDGQFDALSVNISRQLSEVYSTAAEKRGCMFLDAGEYAFASAVDGQHLDEYGHRNLGLALADLIWLNTAKKIDGLCMVPLTK